jgi:hypothetical protein
MKPITDETLIELCGSLVREMMESREHQEHLFKSDWVKNQKWKIVAVESAMRLPYEDLPRLVSVLKAAGYSHCLAVFNEPGYMRNLPLHVVSEPPGDMATCYQVSLDEHGFQEFNRTLGPFRSVLTTEDRTWAISCSEWYNLFGAPPEFLETLLGKSIKEARQEFFEYASLLATGRNPDESVLRIANHYAAL